MQKTPRKYYVLIRTSGRPTLFKRAIESVLSQTIRPEIIVSCDNSADLQYISQYKCKVIMSAPRKEFPTYWNLYLNYMIKQCNGWVIILDDDDYFDNSKVIETIDNVDRTENDIVVYKMQWSTGRIIPSPNHFAKLPFTRGEIGMPCVCFHSDWIKEFDFDGNRAGDYRFFNKLAQRSGQINFLDMVLIQIGNTGLNGKKEHTNQLYSLQ